MPLFKDNQFCKDPWVVLGDDQELTAGTPVEKYIISYARLLAEAERLMRVHFSFGVAVANTISIDQLSQYLPSLALIALDFPNFGDGRSYSLARQIRAAGFLGEVRAMGNILPDQLQMMAQVGFTSFVVPERFPLEVWQKASRQMSLVYQRGLYTQAGEIEIVTAREKNLEA